MLNAILENIGLTINVACWAIVVVVALVAEGATTALISIWFALGGVAAIACAFFGLGLGVQTVVFIVVSVLGMGIIIPIRKKIIHSEAIELNSMIGEMAIAKEDADQYGRLRVTVSGVTYNAEVDKENYEKYKRGMELVITAISGNKLAVDIPKKS